MLHKKTKLTMFEIDGIDKETDMFSREIDLYRAKLGGVHAAQQNHAAIGRQVVVLENRLEKVTEGLI